MEADPQGDDADRAAARRKRMGRAMVILLLALIAVYSYVTYRGLH